MITQLHTPIGCYIPEKNMEGYIHFIKDNGMEDYFYFIVLLDNNEWWELDNRKVRGTFNQTSNRLNPTQNG